jgi:pimeloyl-ACP methyl ester carboxylesterase
VPPPVLLVHGFASSFDHGWREPGWVDVLADEGLEVLGCDLLGHGRAPRPLDPGSYRAVEELVADAVAGHPELDGVGFSAGARVLLTLAASDPSRFRRLVVLGVGENLFRDEDPEPIAEALEAEGEPEDARAALFARLARSTGNDRRALAAFLRRPVPRLGRAELERVRCPVLVVLGEHDFAGPADPLLEALPDARLVVVPGTDHFATPRDARAMAAAVAFLTA